MRLIAGLFLLGMVSTAPAQAKQTQYLSYNIYTGGLKTVSADLHITEATPEQYSMAMNARTEGLLKLFKTWKGTMTTQGHYTHDGQKQPMYHESISVWPDNTQVKEFSWNNNGTLTDLLIAEEGETKDLSDLDKNLETDGVDILTASLSIMQNAAEQGACGGATEVFDGKRQFLLTAENKGWERLKKSRYNQYSGEALRCEIKIVPQDGDWHEKLKGWMAIQEEGVQAGAAPTVWLARLDEDGPAVPVKVMAKTSYGTFLMHLSGYSLPR